MHLARLPVKESPEAAPDLHRLPPPKILCKGQLLPLAASFKATRVHQNGDLKFCENGRIPMKRDPGSGRITARATLSPG